MMVISTRMNNGEGGGGHDKASKLRKQSPYPDIFIDQLCLDLEYMKEHIFHARFGQQTPLKVIVVSVTNMERKRGKS